MRSSTKLKRAIVTSREWANGNKTTTRSTHARTRASTNLTRGTASSPSLLSAHGSARWPCWSWLVKGPRSAVRAGASRSSSNARPRVVINEFHTRTSPKSARNGSLASLSTSYTPATILRRTMTSARFARNGILASGGARHTPSSPLRTGPRSARNGLLTSAHKLHGHKHPRGLCLALQRR